MENSIHSIQLETTSRCNLTCSTCLKAEFFDVWHGCDMDRQLFNRIISQMATFKKKPSVHLQGWGEPLLHSEIYSHIKQLKDLDIPVNFTTNGSLMDRSMAESLVNCGLDGLTFSMAGFSSASQDTLRGADMLDHVQHAIRALVEVRESLPTSKPALAVSYLLTPKTIKELPHAVSWCGKNGVDTFVTVHLTQAGCQTQKDLQFLKSKHESRHYRLLRIHAHVKALLHGIQLNLKNFHPVLTPVCDKNPLNNLFISSNGDVSPCVFLCPPLPQDINWYYNRVVLRQKPLVFGNVRYSRLADIWENPDYRAFRDTFRKRLEFHDTMLSGVSYSLAGSKELESATDAIRHYFALNPPPGPCQACAKIDGF